MSTTLFGKFIANTYQKVLQYDENEDYTGVASFNISELANNNKHTLLNGVGQAVPGIAIDHTDENNGGLFLKNTDKSSGAWGLQIEYGNGSGVDTDPGIQFWRPFGGNYHLFLKNTGTLFVGYQGESSVPQDITGDSLYVKEGIRAGIYNGFANFPQSGRQSNYYVIYDNQILQLGNDDEVFSSGTSYFNTTPSTTLVSFTQSQYCQESLIASTTNLPHVYPLVVMNWIRVGRIVHCSFVTNVTTPNVTKLGESGNLQRIILPIPVTTARGYSGVDSRDPVSEFNAFGSGAVYLNTGGTGENSHYQGSDSSMQSCEVKLGGEGGTTQTQSLYVTVSWNYEGSTGTVTSIRGSFTYPV